MTNKNSIVALSWKAHPNPSTHSLPVSPCPSNLYLSTFNAHTPSQSAPPSVGSQSSLGSSTHFTSSLGGFPGATKPPHVCSSWAGADGSFALSAQIPSSKHSGGGGNIAMQLSGRWMHLNAWVSFGSGGQRPGSPRPGVFSRSGLQRNVPA